MIVETKAGRQALLGPSSSTRPATSTSRRAGAPHVHGSYIVTPVFRLGGVDTDAALRFESERPVEFAELDREARRVLGGRGTCGGGLRRRRPASCGATART